MKVCELVLFALDFGCLVICLLKVLVFLPFGWNVQYDEYLNNGEKKMLDNRFIKLQKVFVMIFVLTMLLGSFVVEAKQSEFTWLDVSKSEWVVSGKIESVAKIEGTIFSEFILADVFFIKGAPYKRKTKVSLYSDLMNSIHFSKDQRVILFLDYHRVHQSINQVYGSKVILESEKLLNELRAIIVQENEIVMSWSGFNDPSSLTTPRGYIRQAIDELYQEETFDKGVSFLFNLPIKDYEYLIYEMYNLDAVSKGSIIESMIPKNIREGRKFCGVTTVFDTISCILEFRLGIAPYPAYSSSSDIEGRWLKFKGWLIYAWYEFK